MDLKVTTTRNRRIFKRRRLGDELDGVRRSKNDYSKDGHSSPADYNSRHRKTSFDRVSFSILRVHTCVLSFNQTYGVRALNEMFAFFVPTRDRDCIFECFDECSISRISVGLHFIGNKYSFLLSTRSCSVDEIEDLFTYFQQF